MRTIFLFLTLSFLTLAQTPTVSPSAPTAMAGQTITLTSSTNVTWSLSGSGTISNQTPTSVSFTAPASVVPQSQMLGCPVLPNDSIFNTRIDALPVNPNSATWVAHMSSLALNILPSWGITYADASTPMITIKPYYGNGSSFPSYSWPAPGRGPGLKRENGNYVGVTGYQNQNDHHTLAIRKSDCTFFELYDDRTNGEIFLCSDGSTPGCNASSANLPYGWGAGMNPFAMPQLTTDAAGLPLAPLSYHLDEIKAGVIKHAIRFTASIGYINGVIWPATTANASAPNAPPYGGRFRLKTAANGGPNLTTVCTSNSILNQDCVTMLTALQQYGMMLADIGFNNQLEAATDLTEDPTTRAALGLIASANINPLSFEAVDESSLQPTTSNGFTSSTSYAVDPANSFVTPVNYALITATPAAGSSVKVQVALQGTAVGLNSNVLTIQAGTWGSYQIASWVNPASFNQNVGWTKVSGVGSVTSGGLYTPPADVSGGNKAVLKVTAVADANAVNYVYVTVLPTGSSPSGAIRIDTGSSTGITDGAGNVWSPDAGIETGASSIIPSDYPSWSASNPEHGVYESSLYTYGHDITYNVVVPNGNYKVRMMFGQAWNGSRGPIGSFQRALTSAPYLLGTQGVIQAHYYDWNYAANYQMATPTDVYVPARVINNMLTVSEQCVTPDTAITGAIGVAPLYKSAYPYLLTHLNSDAKSSVLNGLEIMPDSTPAHWAIDTQQVSTIAPGQSIQLYVTDWYSGDSDVTAPSWSVVTSVPGVTLTSAGLLTLAAGNYFNAQPILVKAKGASHSATTTIYTSAANTYAFLPTRPPFHYYFKRTLTLPPASGSSQTNFPLLVSITDPTLATSDNGGHVLHPSGYDIVPTLDSTCATTNLSFEVETYDPVAGAWTAHVKLPSLPAASSTVTLCYGNPAITTSLAASAAVWDSNFTAVYHFGTLTKDATANSNDTTNFSISATSGLFGQGASFSGVNGQYLAVPIVAEPTNAGTLEAWVYNTAGQGATTNWGVYSDHETSNLFQFGVWYSSLMYFGFVNGSSDYRFTITPSQATFGNSWNHLVYTWDTASNTQTVYVNGAPVSTQTTAFTPFNPTQPLTLGADSYNGFKGILDEVRISRIARSAAWVANEYANQSAPSTFMTIGSETRN